MRKQNRCFAIGMVGIIVTALAHIGFTFFCAELLVQQVFFTIYAVFILLLLIGFRKMLKDEPSKNN